MVTRVDGRQTRESLVATTGSQIPDGATVVTGTVDGQDIPVGVWQWPADPALPALAWAASGGGVTARLAEHGVAAGPVRLRLRSYRPGRRAVVEATTSTGPVFLKVVRPSALSRLVERHRILAGSVPVPRVLAGTDDGVLVLPGLPGSRCARCSPGTATACPIPPRSIACSTPCPRRPPTSPGRAAG